MILVTDAVFHSITVVTGRVESSKTLWVTLPNIAFPTGDCFRPPTTNRASKSSARAVISSLGSPIRPTVLARSELKSSNVARTTRSANRAARSISWENETLSWSLSTLWATRGSLRGANRHLPPGSHARRPVRRRKQSPYRIRPQRPMSTAVLLRLLPGLPYESFPRPDLRALLHIPLKRCITAVLVAS